MIERREDSGLPNQNGFECPVAASGGAAKLHTHSKASSIFDGVSGFGWTEAQESILGGDDVDCGRNPTNQLAVPRLYTTRTALDSAWHGLGFARRGVQSLLGRWCRSPVGRVHAFRRDRQMRKGEIKESAGERERREPAKIRFSNLVNKINGPDQLMFRSNGYQLRWKSLP